MSQQLTPLQLGTIYYSAPLGVNGDWSIEGCSAFFSRYDFVVFADGLQLPAHEYYASSKQIITNITGTGTKVFGYVDLGVSTQNNSDTVMKQRIDAWKSIGATGIFFDDAGYDYNTTRQRQNTYVDYAHSKGMNVFMNPWVAADVLDADKTAKLANGQLANPTGLPHKLTANDYVLLESFSVNTESYASTGGYSPRQKKIDRAFIAMKYRAAGGPKFVSSNAIDPTALLQSPNDAASKHADQYVRYMDRCVRDAQAFQLAAVCIDTLHYSAADPNISRLIQAPHPRLLVSDLAQVE